MEVKVLIKDFANIIDVSIAMFVIFKFTKETFDVSLIDVVGKLFENVLKDFLEGLRMELFHILVFIPFFLHRFLYIRFKVFLFREVTLQGSGYFLSSFKNTFQLIYRLKLRI